MVLLKVIKRDGSTVEFNKSKIRDAITKSMKNGSGILLPDIARLIANDSSAVRKLTICGTVINVKPCFVT